MLPMSLKLKPWLHFQACYYQCFFLSRWAQPISTCCRQSSDASAVVAAKSKLCIISPSRLCVAYSKNVYLFVLWAEPSLYMGIEESVESVHWAMPRRALLDREVRTACRVSLPIRDAIWLPQFALSAQPVRPCAKSPCWGSLWILLLSESDQGRYM